LLIVGRCCGCLFLDFAPIPTAGSFFVMMSVVEACLTKESPTGLRLSAPNDLRGIQSIVCSVIVCFVGCILRMTSVQRGGSMVMGGLTVILVKSEIWKSSRALVDSGIHWSNQGPRFWMMLLFMLYALRRPPTHGTQRQSQSLSRHHPQ
jgi:hypothetical protein